MIDMATEKLFALADVPKLKELPKRRGGKRVNLATVYRWASRGLQRRSPGSAPSRRHQMHFARSTSKIF